MVVHSVCVFQTLSNGSCGRTQLQVYNYNLNQVAWENYYPSDANQEEYLDSVRVLYQPQANVDQPFAIINLPTN